jgi:S-DNA-T family DNA segregation ATPase FtsK/SpoIIIE
VTVATSNQPKKARARPRLPPAKGRELVGLLLLAVALLIALSLATYDPADPSLLHRPAAGGGRAGNLIGPVGAEAAAVGVALLGLTSLIVPVFLLLAGWRRLRPPPESRTVGRGLGALIVLAAAPGLLQFALGELPWRGGVVAAGGAFGRLVVDALEARLNPAGAVVTLVALLAIGAALLVQSTLGELLQRWIARARTAAQEWSLRRARRREHREKERARKRVVAKHLERAMRDRRPEDDEAEAGDGGHGAAARAAAGGPLLLDLPLRVTERRGEGEFSVRRVAAAELAGRAAEGEAVLEPFPAPEEPPAAGADPAAAPGSGARRRPRPRQESLFTATPGPTASGLPPVNLLQMGDERSSVDENDLVRLGETIRGRCAEFGVDGTIEAINPGPVVTVFEFQPAPGVKVSQIVNLQDDLALALKALSVRIDRIPGRSTLGIEVPNLERGTIRLGPLLADKSFERAPSLLTLALGRTIHGEPYVADLATMPHLLVAGATGSGKSVGLQSMITSILYKASRDEVKFILIDPKRIELGVYADIPHLAAEVVVDMKKAANALLRMVKEMEDRYRLLAEVHVRSIAYYNRAIRDPEVKRRLALNDDEGEGGVEELKPLPYYVIVIDELADLMMVSTSEVETAIARLAQMARAVGIHLIVATQRPSVDILTGTIKANFPCRISYATASRHDSRTILDQIGAEQLLGKGDMLFMPPGTARTMRLHGAYVSEQETAALVRWLKKTQGKPDYDPELLLPLEPEAGAGDLADSDDDLYEEAARLVVAERQASASFLQRRMRVGFSRASRLIDMMERDGLLGPPQGSKPREVLVKPDYFSEIDLARRGV